MAEKLFMIALSPTMEEGTILKWTKKEGDAVALGDILCEVETDKASMEYESAQEGTLLKIVRGEGDAACVGDTIAVLGNTGEDIAGLLSEIASESSSESASESGSKASATGAAEANEAKGQSPAPAGASASASAPPITSAGAGSPQASPAPANTSAGIPPTGSPPKGSKTSSPLARKLASQKGIDIAQVQGTGPAGRVIKRDILNFTPAVSAALGRTASAVGMPVEDLVIPVSGKRAVIARRLAESKFSAPHYYVKNTVAMDSLIAARNMLNKEVSEKVSFNAFMLKFASEALKRHPEVNASWRGDTITQFASIDIGLAVDLGNGLITPIVRNTGNKGVVQIDAELKELITKTRENKLKPEEYTGASFSISNLGSFGVDEFTAIINPPGSAILALGRVNKVPVYNESGNLQPVNQMVMTLSCDHRVIDGATAGRFISELQKMMENPVRVLF